jgi:hypothetical protein
MKITTKTVNFIDYSDLEEFLCKTYGLDEVSVPAMLEASNGSSHSVRAEKGPLDEYEQKDVEKFIDDPDSVYGLHTIFKDLCNKDLIAPGNYVIQVSW